MHITISQYDTLAMLYVDRSTWYDIAHYPSLTLCKRMVRLADWAASAPDCWRASLRRFEASAGSGISELAVLLGTLPRYAAQRCRSTDLTLADDREAVDYYDDIPAWLVAPEVRYADDGATTTYRNGRALAHYAADNPRRYTAQRLSLINGMSQEQIAQRIGITQRHVSSYLASIPRLVAPRARELREEFFGKEVDIKNDKGETP